MSAEPLSVPVPALIPLSSWFCSTLPRFLFSTSLDSHPLFFLTLLDLPLSSLLSPSSPAFILSPADSHQPVLVANAELSGCDNTLRCSSCHRFIELLK